MGWPRLIVAMTGVILVLVAAVLLIDASDPRRWTWVGLAGLAGLTLAGAMAAWRRSWQRGRQHRQRWGSAAWLALWVSVGTTAVSVALVSAPVTTVVPTLLGGLAIGLAVTPAPRPQVKRPRFTEGWLVLPVTDGRVVVGGGSLAVPPEWTAWRVPEDQAADGFVLLPPGRRWDLPMPMLGGGRMSAADAAEAGSPEEMADRILAEIPADAPIALADVRRGSAVIDGEAAVTLDFEARLLSDRLPAPGVVASLGLWIAGIGPIAGRVYLLDRAGERWLIGWIGWADARSSVERPAEEAILSWRWTTAQA
jgi:hypothetical protein